MPAVAFRFDRFELDPVHRRLTASGEPVALPDRHFDVLQLLVARAGHIVAKDDLLQVGWKDVAVGDNSLEQAISSLRRLLGSTTAGGTFIETVARRGYRFAASVAHRAVRESDTELESLLAPYRAFVEGRAALESFEAGQVGRARDVFERAVAVLPDHASSHIGLANAGLMQFEATRADEQPDVGALMLALDQAREACRLDATSGEAWATLGFALHRTGHRGDALAAVKRALALEPDNWRHHLRLATIGWGEERLRAAKRTLALLPGFPSAHWLVATVHVARQAFDEAERELRIALDTPTPGAGSRFGAVGVHWLLGLLRLANDDPRGAREQFERELTLEESGHLYARECCANAWYALGALAIREKRRNEAIDAFAEAERRVTRHRLARVGRTVIEGPADPGQLFGSTTTDHPLLVPGTVDEAIARAIFLSLQGDQAEAVRIVERALLDAPAGSSGWVLPLEPLLHATAHRHVWADALARLRDRAA